MSAAAGDPTREAQPMDVDQGKSPSTESSSLMSDAANEIKYMTPDTRNEKLLESCTEGDLERVTLLLRHGADIQTTDSGGNTPLHRACWKGKLNVVEFLIKTGAQVETGTLMGNTPLHRASYNGHTEVVMRLLDAGADVEARCRYGHTAMFAAAHYGHIDTLEYIILRNCDLDARNDLGQTALHVVAHKCQKNAKSIIDCLLNAGVDIEATEDQGYTAMHSAAYFGRMDCVKYLLGKGADIEARGHHGFTPLLSATLGMRYDIIKALLKMGADWNVVSTGPETITDVLHRAKRSEGYKTHKEQWNTCEDLLTLWTNASKEELILQCLFKKLLNIPGNKMTQFSGWMVDLGSTMEFGVSDFLWTTRECERIGTELAVQYSPYEQATCTISTQTCSTMTMAIPEQAAKPLPALVRLVRENSNPPDATMQEATGRDEKHREGGPSHSAPTRSPPMKGAARKRSIGSLWRAFTSASYYFSWGADNEGPNR